MRNGKKVWTSFAVMLLAAGLSGCLSSSGPSLDDNGTTVTPTGGGSGGSSGGGSASGGGSSSGGSGGSSSGGGGSSSSGSNSSLPGGKKVIASWLKRIESITSPTSGQTTSGVKAGIYRNFQENHMDNGRKGISFSLNDGKDKAVFRNCKESCSSNSSIVGALRYKKYTYGIMGRWENVHNINGNGMVISRFFSTGELSKTLPKNYTAEYRGNMMFATSKHRYSNNTNYITQVMHHIGDVHLYADFNTKKLQGISGNFRGSVVKVANNVQNKLTPEDGKIIIDGVIYSNHTNYKIRGKLPTLDGAKNIEKGFGEGAFFGPNGAEVGGSFIAKTDSGHISAGAFYARRTR